MTKYLDSDDKVSGLRWQSIWIKNASRKFCLLRFRLLGSLAKVKIGKFYAGVSPVLTVLTLPLVMQDHPGSAKIVRCVVVFLSF